MKTWKCENGHIVTNENLPEKCSQCESVKFEEVITEVPKDIEQKVEKVSNDIDNKRIVNLEKKVETLLEELKLEREARQKTEKEKERAILETEKKYADAERLKEIEIEEAKQKDLDEKAETLRIAKEKDTEANEWKEKFEKKEFETFKLRTSIEKPYLAKILEKCDTKEKYEIMMELIDENELKAKYEQKKNSYGSMTNIPGTRPIEESKPLTMGQILANRVTEKTNKILEKRKRR